CIDHPRGPQAAEGQGEECVPAGGGEERSWIRRAPLGGPGAPADRARGRSRPRTRQEIVCVRRRAGMLSPCPWARTPPMVTGTLSRPDEEIPMTPRPPVPPFTRESALQKVQAAEDAWNTCDPVTVSQA